MDKPRVGGDEKTAKKREDMIRDKNFDQMRLNNEVPNKVEAYRLKLEADSKELLSGEEMQNELLKPVFKKFINKLSNENF